MTTPDDSPDVEVGRYALRSFRFSIESQTPEVGETIGWWTDGRSRVWRPISYRAADAWLDGTCEAVCLRRFGTPAHTAPAQQCSCGIYGSLSYADVLHQFPDACRHIVAVIAAEGITIIGSRGLRTQYARVVAYWADPSRLTPGEPSYRDVAELQFKDARPFDCPADMVDAYGLALLPRRSAGGAGWRGCWWTGTPG